MSSTAGTLERIEKLIALAGSDNANEARSAAYRACKMIREGGFRVVAPREAARAEPWDDDPFMAMWRAAAGAAAPRSTRPTRPEPDRRPRRAVPTEIRRARRSGRCEVCHEPFEEGSDVAVPAQPEDVKLGTVHADCRARWVVLAEP